MLLADREPMTADPRTQRLLRLLNLHRDQAMRVAFRMGAGSQEAAEDLVQDAFVRAHDRMGSLRDSKDAKAWFFRILVRLAANQRRHRDVRTRHEDSVRLLYPATTNAGAPDPALRDHVHAAIARLTESQRAVVVLVYLEQFTLDEAASILDRAPGTIRSHLHRALLSLRRDLEPQMEEHR